MLYLDNRESVNKADSFLYYRSTQEKGYRLPDITEQDVIFTQSKEVVSHYSNHNVKILSEYLGLKEEMGLYELFSFFFDGKVKDDFDMIEALFNGFLRGSDWCFCLKVGVTFCWFTVEDKRLNKLGTMQFSEQPSKYTIGKFIKRLRYNIAKSGINLARVKNLVWSKEDLEYEFGSYITQYDCLSTFFLCIKGVDDLGIEGIIHFLSKNTFIKRQVTAEALVDCLNDNFSALGLNQEEGVLLSKSIFYKDYSSISYPLISQSECSYGIIIDCEGQLGLDGDVSHGCRNLGGIIYCRYRNTLACVDTFSCDELLLEDTLLQVLRNYKDFAGSYRHINIICYGASDEKMLKASINNLCSRKSIKTLNNLFCYKDCKSFIIDYLQSHKVYVDGRQTLSNIAKALYVKPLFPKHKPSNDAKTLFNILAQILFRTDKFCV